MQVDTGGMKQNVENLCKFGIKETTMIFGPLQQLLLGLHAVRKLEEISDNTKKIADAAKTQSTAEPTPAEPTREVPTWAKPTTEASTWAEPTVAGPLIVRCPRCANWRRVT